MKTPNTHYNVFRVVLKSTGSVITTTASFAEALKIAGLPPVEGREEVLKKHPYKVTLKRVAFKQ